LVLFCGESGGKEVLKEEVGGFIKVLHTVTHSCREGFFEADQHF